MTITRFKGESAVAVLLYELESLNKVAKELDDRTRFCEPDIEQIQQTLNKLNLQVQKVNLKLLIALSRVKK
jgi:hypothetical protein